MFLFIFVGIQKKKLMLVELILILVIINAGKSVVCNSIEYDKDYMRIEFNSDDNLSLNKILRLLMLTKIVRSIFKEDGKYYPRVFLDDCLYEL